MAGRGTDIMLGGNVEFLAKAQMEKEGFEHDLIVEATGKADTEDENILKARERYEELYTQFKPTVEAEAEEVKAAGGLCIIGTERHESRRIDNQLRGRAGRQGDVGESTFYLSLEDELLRLFGGERVSHLAEMMNLPEDEPIDAKILSNAIENAQKKVESVNFQRRKRVLEYDDVNNQQRQIIYEQRRKVLDGEDLKATVLKMLEDVINNAEAQFMADDVPENWDLEGLKQRFLGICVGKDDLNFSEEELKKLKKEEILSFIRQRANEAYERSERDNTPEKMRELERVVLLKTVDKYWMDHIDAMDDLRQGVSLRAYSNRDPVIEYKFESYDMFDEMVNSIKFETVRNCICMRIIRPEMIQRRAVAKADDPGTTAGMGGGPKAPVRKTAAEKVGKNDPCPCGSGKKYKKCCGAGE